VVSVKCIIIFVIGGVAGNIFFLLVGIINCSVVTAWDFSGRFIDDRRIKRRKFISGWTAFMFFWII